MSNFSQVSELLTHNAKLHQAIGDFYAERSDATGDQRTKLLLQTLIKHEKELAEELNNYLQQAPAKIVDTYFQFDHEFDPIATLKANTSVQQVNTDTVEQWANFFDDYFARLYTEMIREAEIEAVRELFENLYEHIAEEKKRLSTDIYSLWDM